jgi:prophage antirepressor-like protein
MTKKQAIQLFEEKKVRTVWDNEQEKWYFCVADVVEALTDSVNPTDYIKKMKKRDPELAKGWGQIVTPPFPFRQQVVNRGSIAQRNRVSSALSKKMNPNKKYNS